MSEKKKNNTVQEEETPITQEQPQEKDEKQERIDILEEELAKLKDQYLRTLAEYDNYRKRTEKEKLNIYNDALIATVNDILPIADNIERALSLQDCSSEDMRKGVEMIYQQFQASMKKLGVEEMAGEGEEFNPELHNAVAHIEDENLGDGVISAVFQKGYMMGDKVVRHAMVQVAN